MSKGIQWFLEQWQQAHDHDAYLKKVFAPEANDNKLLPLRPDQVEWLVAHNAKVTDEGYFTFPDDVSNEEIWIWLRILAQ